MSVSSFLCGFGADLWPFNGCYRNRFSFSRKWPANGRLFSSLIVACVAGAKRGRRGGGRKALPSLPYPPPYPLPLSTPATQATLIAAEERETSLSGDERGETSVFRRLSREGTVYSTTHKTAINRPMDHTGET